MFLIIPSMRVNNRISFELMRLIVMNVRYRTNNSEFRD